MAVSEMVPEDEAFPTAHHPESHNGRVMSAQEYANEGMEYVVENTGVAIFENSFIDEEDEDDSDEVRWLREARKKHADMKWWTRPSVVYLCAILAAIGLTESFVIPPTTLLSMKRVCESIAYSDNTWNADGSPICDSAKVQKELSELNSIVFLVNGIAGTLLSGKLGQLSDRFGRVPIFIYISFMKAAGLALMIYVFVTSRPFPRTLFIVGQCIPSLGASTISLIANGNSYISDIVEPEARPLYISFVMSTIYGAIGLGPFFSSLLVKASNGNNFVPMWTALVLAVCVTLVCAFLMGESRHDMAKQKSQVQFLRRRQSMESIATQNSSTGTLGSISVKARYTLAQFFDFLSPIRKLWIAPTVAGSLIPRYMVLLLVTIDCLFMTSTAASIPALVLAFVFMFNWNSEELGYFVSCIGLGRAAALLFLAPLVLHFLKKRFKVLEKSIDHTDTFVIRTSLVFILLSLIAVIAIPNEMAVVIFVLFQVLSSMLSPTIQSTVIKYGSKSSTGEYFGALALIRSGTMMVLPSFFLSLYSHTVSINPTLFVYIPLTMSVLACVLSAFLKIVEDPELLRRQSEVALPTLNMRDAKTRYGSTSSIPKPQRRESSAKSLRIPTTR